MKRLIHPPTMKHSIYSFSLQETLESEVAAPGHKIALHTTPWKPQGVVLYALMGLCFIPNLEQRQPGHFADISGIDFLS